MGKSENKILFILHFPPPVHGSSVVGKYIKDSNSINEVFDSRYINLGTSVSIDEIGKGGYKKLLRYIKIIFEVLFQLITFRPNLCYLAIATKGGAFYKDLVIALILKIFGFPVVYHLHNKGIKDNQEKRLDNFLYTQVYKGAHVILLSRHLYPDIKKYVREIDISYCPNGIPERTLGKKKIHKEQSSKPNILFLSNLIESKGVYVLLEACKILKEENIHFSCSYVGGVGDVNEKQFKQKVQELKLEDQVKYYGKKVGPEKEKFFSEADIFAFPTFYHNETFGLVNLEAMQFSLPIVSTFEGGIPDVVENGKTGFLVPQKDAVALAEKLGLLIQNPHLRKKMGAEGFIKYQNEFTLSIFESRFKSILFEILNRKKTIVEQTS